MASKPKKWRLKLVPVFAFQRFPSKAATYRAVEHFRGMYAERMSRIHHVDVEVDEGDGWVLYERIIFPEVPA